MELFSRYGGVAPPPPVLPSWYTEADDTLSVQQEGIAIAEFIVFSPSDVSTLQQMTKLVVEMESRRLRNTKDKSRLYSWMEFLG